MPESKKYKLFSKAQSAGEKPVCAFFASPAGCRNGDKCAFVHSTQAQPTSSGNPVGAVSDTSSVVSSESEGERKGPIVQENLFIEGTPSNKTQQKTQDSDPAANTSEKKKRKSKNPGNDIFANPKASTTTAPPAKKAKVKQSPAPTRKEKSPAPSADFRSLVSNLPVASFMMPQQGSKNEAGTNNGQAPPSSNKVSSPELPKTDDMHPLPTSTEVGRKWQKVVEKTRCHERYSGAMDFAKYKEANKESGIQSEWIKAKPFGSWCASNPQVIAIDCEMCETEDPLSGVKNHKALCRLSVVNAEKPEEVLLDTLVKPSWPVRDYRTWINGISKENLDNVEFTLRHAQAFMMALCSEETVIVGHAVNNDLAALNMEHYCVADSSFLFQAKDSTNASVSLKDLVKALYKIDMPDTHDSVNDARKSLECVRHWIDNGGNVQQIERSPKHHKGNQLFVHRIPKQCKPEHLSTMFLKHTSVEPSDVGDIEFPGETGKAFVTFKSTRHANLAFETLEGAAEEEKSGRLQKKVYLRSGGYVRVRKMVHSHSSRHGTPSKSSHK